MTTTTAPATVTAPAATTNGRAIALAHYSARALLERVLTSHGITFEQSVTLRAVVAAGESIGFEALVGDVTGSLKADAPVVRGVIEELITAKLLQEDPAQASPVRLTDAGRELYERTSAESAEISARLYADIPEEDLAVAGRVLALLTERANAALAGV
ncbi:MarR family winged helix-turn-helix transcriptional regulator [Streptomyces sp. NBC_01304]|uniref:MarR family winged helix-turn-helix transcriptional regulator n=1 Tax=Streptomyces sp. NBC_01304 TaxID=2903818 RepID=UPI002E115750|nr:MarR family transcriptional regulator [Streptomyces sp. NBC_01304]